MGDFPHFAVWVIALALSNRIAVLYEGEIMSVVNRSETNAVELGLMMAGERKGSLATVA